MEEEELAIVDAVCAYDEYVQAQHRAHTRLQQAFFKLSNAKLQLPPHTLSENSYPEAIQASYLCQIEEIDAPSPEQSLQRRHASTPSSTEQPPDPILHFSSLPPSTLRQSQRQFIAALKELEDAAKAVQRISK